MQPNKREPRPGKIRDGRSRVVRWNVCQMILGVLFKSKLTEEQLAKMYDDLLKKYPVK